MIVLRTPKGWTGPKEVEGKPVEGCFRAHQVPVDMSKPEHVGMVEAWLRSYHPEKLFNEDGSLRADLKELAPKGDRRIGANPHANGGKLLRDLVVPDFRNYGVKMEEHGTVTAQDMTELGRFVADVFRANQKSRNFRSFSPDEALSNRLNYAFEATNRQWEAPIEPNDELLSSDGRFLDSFLSEHMCEGWLEGYLLTGRHGFFDSYEAFARIIDSMAAQHAKWLKVCNQLSWR